LQPKTPDEPHLTSWNDFCRLVLEGIAELSPCTEPTLFVIAASRGLERFGDGTLADLRKLLGQCVQELKARGLVEISGEQLVIATASSAGNDDILDLTADVESQPQSVNEKPAGRVADDILELTAELELQPQSVREKSARPTGDEDILDLTAELELYEVEDLLELTAELELRTSKLDKAPRDQQKSQTQAPVTGRPKGAPEPTREEIIAAMRRFISDG
jgi:hypothetical protein